MKKIFLIIAVIAFAFPVQAKVVKLGRSASSGMYGDADSNFGSRSDPVVQENCSVNQYKVNDECKACPSGYYCNGVTKVGYCEQVSCINARPVAFSSGCSCDSYCNGVVCVAGYNKVATANGCSCE